MSFRPFLKSSNPFKPAVEILADKFGLSQTSRQSSHNRSHSNADDDPGDMSFSTLDTPKSKSGARLHSRTSSAELEPTAGIPLIDYSRTPSPTPYRTRSDTQSEDDDDNTVPISLRPLVSQSSDQSLWKVPWRDGGLGAFLFGSWAGWQVYVGLITTWHVTASIFLVFFNRVILMCKSSHPITTIQLQPYCS
jgi:hypothetical protein